MGRSWEVVIAGLGITGAAATLELARRGLRVLALDRYHPPHTLGSSHGATRIIREAYFEHPLYVPLVRRAFDGWAAIEREAGVTLFRRTGALTLGPEDGQLVRGTMRSARIHAIPHEVLSAAGVQERFPHLDPPDNCIGVLEQRAGILYAERCLQTLIDLARSAGAEIGPGEPLETWERAGDGLVFRTPARELPCARIVLAAGPWLPRLLAANGMQSPARIEVERQVVGFFGGGGATPGADGPVLLWEYAADRVFYALPDGRGGVKAGIHHDGAVFDPETTSRDVNDGDVTRITALLDRIAPGTGPLGEASVCLYTNMPDGHFLIDAHTDEPNLVVASACSGHGFKFAPALAPLVADLTLRHPTGPEAAPFRWRGRRTPV